MSIAHNSMWTQFVCVQNKLRPVSITLNFNWAQLVCAKQPHPTKAILLTVSILGIHYPQLSQADMTFALKNKYLPIYPQLYVDTVCLCKNKVGPYF